MVNERTKTLSRPFEESMIVAHTAIGSGNCPPIEFEFVVEVDIFLPDEDVMGMGNGPGKPAFISASICI